MQFTMVPVEERLPRNGFYHVLLLGRYGKNNDSYAEFRDGKWLCPCWRCNDEIKPPVVSWGETPGPTPDRKEG